MGRRALLVVSECVRVVETSRGCTFDCSFCSIIEMRGRNFHRFPIERVIEDISDAVARGARSLFIVDDNITLDMPRFEELCTPWICFIAMGCSWSAGSSSATRTTGASPLPQSGVRTQVRGLAIYSAPDSVSRYTLDTAAGCTLFCSMPSPNRLEEPGCR
jgi:hypothetical protein